MSAAGYANGKTYRPNCIHVGGCDAAAERMVGAESLCEEHAAHVEEQNARSRARILAWADSPEGRAEARAEHALESRVS